MLLKKLLFSLVVFILVFVILEIGATLLESAFTPAADIMPDERPGWQAEFFQYRMDFHEPDSQLLWRHRPNLNNPLILTNSEGLLGGEISRRKGERDFRILLLGDSSPVGLGLSNRNEAFGEQLRYMLSQYFGGSRKVELINAAVSGHTSEQLRRFFERRGPAYQPDLVIVYCGNNDASISGQFTDRQLFENQTAVGLRELCGKLAIYRILKSLLSNSHRITPDDPKSLTVRVTPAQYYENLRAIADIGQERKCPVIFIKPAVARLWPAGLQFKIFRHITGEDGRPSFPDALAKILGREIKYCLDAEQLNLHDQNLDEYKKAVYESAYEFGISDSSGIERYQAALTGNPEDPVFLNNLGVSFWEEGQFDSAEVYLRRAREVYMHGVGDDPGLATIAAGSPFLFNLGVNYISKNDSIAANIMLDSALQADYFSLRIKNDYWSMIDSLGGREDVFMVDLPEIFNQNGGDDLFVDHCHPTREGHRLIARTLFDFIRANSLTK